MTIDEMINAAKEIQKYCSDTSCSECQFSNSDGSEECAFCNKDGDSLAPYEWRVKDLKSEEETLDEAMKIIDSYCDNHKCDECRFYGEDGCGVAVIIARQKGEGEK